MAVANLSSCTSLADPAHEIVWIEGGEFRMGSNSHYPEEGPAHRVRVDGFHIDPYPVTNRQFAAFCRRDRLSHGCRAATEPRRLPRRLAEYA